MNVAALIVTYNRLEKLKTTIEATLALPFQYIVVVNNASTDDTQAYLDSVCDERVKVLHREVNDGGAGGFKYGAQWITQNLNTDWVLFYDDDAYPNHNFGVAFQALDLSIENVYVCTVVDTSGNYCKMNIPWKKIPNGILGNIAYRANSARFIPDGHKQETVVSVSFVGMLISQETLKKSISFIYDELFIYYDDVYFGHHLVLQHTPIIYLPELCIVHDIDTTNKLIAPWKLYYLSRNLILSRKIFQDDSPFTLFDVSLRLLKYIFTALKHDKRKECMINVYNGIKDGFWKPKGRGA
ncbi:glycosyltransferase [Klebsiella sp. 141198]|uniref:glycosyltransferase n=1 Tax=Klebsiella sp. 141198 TaxID=3020036 RepID=UPI003D332270